MFTRACPSPVLCRDAQVLLNDASASCWKRAPSLAPPACQLLSVDLFGTPLPKLRPQTTTPLISECPLQDPSTGLEKQPEPEPGLGWACLGCPARAALAPSLFETAALEDRTDQPASRDTRQTELAWPGRGHFGSLSLSFFLSCSTATPTSRLSLTFLPIRLTPSATLPRGRLGLSTHPFRPRQTASVVFLPRGERHAPNRLYNSEVLACHPLPRASRVLLLCRHSSPWSDLPPPPASAP